MMIMSSYSCYWLINAKTLSMLSLINQFLSDDNELLLNKKTYLTRSFQHSVSILTNIMAFFVQHLLKIRIIPSPAKQKQTKTTQQQIHSHLKKVHVSRFPVVSNEAIQDLNSVAVNKHTKSFDLLNKTVNERMSSKASASSDPAILKNIS